MLLLHDSIYFKETGAHFNINSWDGAKKVLMHCIQKKLNEIKKKTKQEKKTEKKKLNRKKITGSKLVLDVHWKNGLISKIIWHKHF